MYKIIRFLSLAIGMLLVTTAVSANETTITYRETEVTMNGEPPTFSFISYVSLGGGSSFIDDEKLPYAEVSSGFQLAPWIGIGFFCAGNPLSNFEHANFGIHLADKQASYALMSGTELLFTPQAERKIHPLLRLAVGGVNVGYLVDLDGEEGYEQAKDNRYFYASISTGVEMNLTEHLRLSLRTGWRFVGNDYTLGLQEGDLSGPECTLSIRTLWKTALD